MPRAARALTAGEVACVTGVPLKQVHRIIDSGMLMREPWISKFSPERTTSGRSTLSWTCFQNFSATSFFEAFRRTAVHHSSG